MMLGQIDYHLVKPWSPDHGLYPAVSEFLSRWARSGSDGFTMFQIAAPEHTVRAHEIRDLLTRFNTPFAFHATESPEGASLLREAGHTASRLPTAVRHDGRVLVDPSDGDLVEALGGGTRVGVDVYDVAIVGAPRRALGRGLRSLRGARDHRARAPDLGRPGRVEHPHP